MRNVRQTARVIGVCQVFHLQLTVVMGNVRGVVWLILSQWSILCGCLAFFFINCDYRCSYFVGRFLLTDRSALSSYGNLLVTSPTGLTSSERSLTDVNIAADPSDVGYSEDNAQDCRQRKLTEASSDTVKYLRMSQSHNIINVSQTAQWPNFLRGSVAQLPSSRYI